MVNLADKYITQDGVVQPVAKKSDDTYKKLVDKYILPDGSIPMSDKDYDAMMERTIIYGRPKLNLQKLQRMLIVDAAGGTITNQEVSEIADSFTLVDLS
jgi:hypothetical protein